MTYENDGLCSIYTFNLFFWIVLKDLWKDILFFPD